MGKQIEKKKNSPTLRQQAEKKLRNQTVKPLHELSASDSLNLIHELQVHQIELEMQNEELRTAQEVVEDSRKRYSDLYDFAPIGYFAFDKNGLILEANITGAEQLGIERSSLIKKPFSRFIHKDDADVYYLHRQEVMKSEKRKTCEVRMKRSDKTEFYAQLASTSIKDESGSTLIRSAVMNITEHVEAEEALKESEELHRITLTSISDAVFITDKAGVFTYICPNVSVIFGYSFDEVRALSNISKLLGKNLFDHKKLKASKEIQNIELIIKDKEGRTHVLLTNVKSVDIKGGTILYTCHDITERNKTEVALHESEAQFRIIIEKSPIPMVITDQEGYIDHFNSKFTELFGWTTVDIKTPNEWWNAAYPDETYRVKVQTSWIQAVEEANISGNEIKPQEWKLTCKNGKIRDIEFRMVPISASRKVIVMIDLTERKKAEEQILNLSKFPSENPNPVLRIDRGMNILYKNEAVSSILKKEKLSEKNISTILPDNLKKWIIDSLNTGNPVHDLDVKVADKIFSYSISPVKENQYVNLYAIDITDRKKAEVELQRHRQQLMKMVDERTSELQKINEELELEIAERMRVEAESINTSHLVALGELAAGVAHEINNPINGIINYAQMLANKTPQGSKEQDVAHRVIKEGDRIANIVNSLLSFARAVNTAKERVHIMDIMSESIALTQAQIRNDGIHLNIDIPESIPDITAQPQQIEQVFLNLISNSRHALNQKYPGADKNKILGITAKEISVNNQLYVQMSFYDKGHGIPAEILDKIMNPFFTNKPNGAGTGLGLSISHGIINDHNGRIIVNSAEGEYTEVIIDLPVIK